MKNFFKVRIASLFGIIALAAVIVFSLGGCSTLLNMGATAAVQGVARSQARSAHTRVVAKASEELLKVLSKNSKVWIHNRATGNEIATAAGIIDDLTSIMMENDIVPVDRESAALLAAERNIQLSGDVRDTDIMSIGNQIGAQYLVSINIIVTNPGNAGIVRRVQMRVLNIETASVLYQSDTGDDWRIR